MSRKRYPHRAVVRFCSKHFANRRKDPEREPLSRTRARCAAHSPNICQQRVNWLATCRAASRARGNVSYSRSSPLPTHDPAIRPPGWQPDNLPDLAGILLRATRAGQRNFAESPSGAGPWRTKVLRRRRARVPRDDQTPLASACAVGRHPASEGSVRGCLRDVRY